MLNENRVLVLGLGLSGRSAARFLMKNGASVAALDDRSKILIHDPEVIGLLKMGMEIVEDLFSMTKPSFVVVSPGMPPTHPAIAYAEENQWEIIGEVELACRYLKNPMVGVTGTNGKTTVTLLTAHILNQAGYPARALGNSGVPLSSILDRQEPNEEEIYVIELSSYQLETLYAKCLKAGVILNVTPDHLDRYDDMNDYAAAKFHLKDCLIEDGTLYIGENCPPDFFLPAVKKYGYSKSSSIYTDLETIFLEGNPVFQVPENLKGKQSHDLENMMASFALCHIFNIEVDRFLDYFKTFAKPPHRIEFVRNIDGIVYVDDSKGTNLDAVIKAVQSVDGKVILIAGGVDKGFSFHPWIHSFAGKVKHICAIGQTAEKIKTEVGYEIPTTVSCSLEEAVKLASKNAVSGETVLLSPGCSSFDMFRDYVQRGEEFKRLVKAL